MFSNAGLPVKELAKLENACRKEGLSLDKIGMAFGTQQPRPEIFLLDYDLAFAVGRSALEALACGCAVIPVIPGQAGHLITMENFAEWAYANFSPRYYASAAQVDTQWLNGELRAYSPKTAAQLTAKVRGEHALSDAVDRLEKIYRGAIDDYTEQGPGPHVAEFAPYLERLSLEVDAMWKELEHHRQNARLIEQHQGRISKRWRSHIRELLDRIGTRKT